MTYTIEFQDIDATVQYWVRGEQGYATPDEAQRSIHDTITRGGAWARRVYRVVPRRKVAPVHPELAGLMERFRGQGSMVAFWCDVDGVEALLIDHENIAAAMPGGPVRWGRHLGGDIDGAVRELVALDLEAAARERAAAQERERWAAYERERQAQERAAQERAAAQERERLERERQAAQERERWAAYERERQAQERAAAQEQERRAAQERERQAQEHAARQRAAAQEQERRAAQERERQAQEHAARQRAAAQEQERRAAQERERQAQERAAQERAAAQERERRAAQERERQAQERAAQERAARERERAAQEAQRAAELNAALVSPVVSKPPSSVQAAPAARVVQRSQASPAASRPLPPPITPSPTPAASPTGGASEIVALGKLLRCGAWREGVRSSELFTTAVLPPGARAALQEIGGSAAPTPRAIGNALKRVIHRRVDGLALKLTRTIDGHGFAVWQVVHAPDEASAPSQIEPLRGALKHLGYRPAEINQAVAALAGRIDREPIAELVREALRVLTPRAAPK
jgi:hypothetical protein